MMGAITNLNDINKNIEEELYQIYQCKPPSNSKVLNNIKNVKNF